MSNLRLVAGFGAIMVLGWLFVVYLYKYIVVAILVALGIGFVWYKASEAIDAWRMRDND